jgi:hypothetical protein
MTKKSTKRVNMGKIGFISKWKKSGNGVDGKAGGGNGWWHRGGGGVWWVAGGEKVVVWGCGACDDERKRGELYGRKGKNEMGRGKVT